MPNGETRPIERVYEANRKITRITFAIEELLRKCRGKSQVSSALVYEACKEVLAVADELMGKDMFAIYKALESGIE